MSSMWPEYFPDKQGRPSHAQQRDLDSGRPILANNALNGIVVTTAYTHGEVAVSYSAGPYTVILVGASRGSVTITMPNCALYNGRYYIIKKMEDGGQVIVATTSYQTIDGATSVVLDSPYQYVTIISDGAEWFIIGGEYVGLEATLKEEMAELKTINEQLLIELKKANIHNSILTGENVTPKDTE